MISWLGNLVMHPALLAGGAALLTAPILIHLLNKRKFRIVEWAAMDFLFDANKKNRRRVRLEDLLILILRTLAVLLIVLLLARPFLSGAALGALVGTTSHERVVLLDDSPSMDAHQTGETPFEQSKRLLIEQVRELGSHHSSDTLTLAVTSRPRQPIVSSVTLNPESVDRLVADISALKVSSRSARYEDALPEVEKLFTSRVNLNCLLYVITDLRERDWPVQDKQQRLGTVPLLSKIAEKTTGCYLVDVGGNQIENLAITAIVPQSKVLAAGTTCRFDVTVHNYGPSEVSHVGVRFQPEGSQAIEEWIDRIGPRESASLPFSFTFARSGDSGSGGELDPIAIRAELIGLAGAEVDRLAADNVRYYPARLVQGIPTLVVDGDPTADPRRAESYFLRFALASRGDVPSGIALRVATAAEFETINLDQYQVIYLANVDRIDDNRRESLEAWVRRGGGLVLALGDQLADASRFNLQFFRRGEGLCPVEVDAIEGDEQERQWALFNVVQKGHAVFGIFEGENNPLLEGVKVFRWWHSHVPEESLRSGKARVLVQLTDSEHSPLIVEQTFGRGKVVALTTPIDADWSNWPPEPSYVPVMLYLTRYLARTTALAGLVEVGQPLIAPFDLVKYKLEVMLTRPDGERVGLQPAQAAANPQADKTARKSKPSARASEGEESTWALTYPDTDERGFYRFELARNDGGSDTLLFAANMDSQEGDLTRADATALSQQFASSKVRIISGAGLREIGAEGSKAELWLTVLGTLGLVLGSEQVLAWFFGRKR